MKNFIVIFVVVFLFSNCQAQKKTDLNWKTYTFDEAGLKIDFPCEIKRSFKSFQEQPRPIRVFSYQCESDGIKYLASLNEHMDEFSEDKIPSLLKSTEEYLPALFKDKGLEVKFLKTEETKRNNFPARTFDAEIGGKDRWSEFTFVNSRGRFNATTVLIIEKGKEKTTQIEQNYNLNSQKFFDSFNFIN